MEFEDLRVRNWEDLTEEIISLCINELEEYLRRKGGILDIKELVKKLPEHLKKTYGRILYAYRDDVARKIKELEFYKEKIEEIIKELNI